MEPAVSHYNGGLTSFYQTPSQLHQVSEEGLTQYDL